AGRPAGVRGRPVPTPRVRQDRPPYLLGARALRRADAHAALPAARSRPAGLPAADRAGGAARRGAGAVTGGGPGPGPVRGGLGGGAPGAGGRCGDLLYGGGGPRLAADVLRRYPGCLLVSVRDGAGRCVTLLRGPGGRVTRHVHSGVGTRRDHTALVLALYA